MLFLCFSIPGPPVRYNNIDYNRYTTTTEKPSAQTHLPLSYLLPIVFFIICMIGLIVVIGLRAYYTIHKTEHDPLVGRSDLEMREPLASKDVSWLYSYIYSLAFSINYFTLNLRLTM